MDVYRNKEDNGYEIHISDEEMLQYKVKAQQEAFDYDLIMAELKQLRTDHSIGTAKINVYSAPGTEDAVEFSSSWVMDTIKEISK